MDGVDLSFDEDALRAVAKQAIERKTGARGLRAILESVMLDIMFDIPSDETITACRITEDTINHKTAPVITKRKKSSQTDPDKPKAKRTPKSKQTA